MINIVDFIQEKLRINKYTKVINTHPKDKNELVKILNELIEDRGDDANLNDIDVSKITDMSSLFGGKKFNGDISQWDVSNVRNMKNMFNNSKFDGDISEWNVSNVENMESMFAYSKFTGKNGDISNWDVKKVKKWNYIFFMSPISENPPKWYK